MSRAAVLATPVPPVEERIRAIEAEPLPRNLSELLAAAAHDAPDAAALDFFEDGERYTYAGLQAAVSRLAGGFAGIGIAHGTHVGVMLPNVAAFPITWLALARLGAVMIPINPAYTVRELEYVVDNGEITWLCVAAERSGIVDELAATAHALPPERIIVVGGGSGARRSWETLAGGDPAALPPPDAVAADDLVNIQYTSGTTGFPKGCMLAHRYWLTIGKVNACRDGREYRRILAATPFFYMDPQWMLVMSMVRRGCLFVARRQSASRFMGWVRQLRIQFTLFPEIVYKQPPTPLDRDHELIRVNVYGLSRHNHAALEERFDVIAREAFGMTEIGSGAFMPIEATDMVGSGACGRAAPFRELAIVDANGTPLPPGEPGELVVRGPGILQGYYRNPEATRNAFFGDWFRSGDVARIDARGYLYIVGRMKDMIRRAGENIAAREVEAVLRAIPEVADAAAVPVPDPVRGEEVKAYIVLRPGITVEALPPGAIAAHCARGLARFKVPRYYAYRDHLPRTPSEKIAKHKLVAEQSDLRVGAFDRVDGIWR
jgi:crotonobetaine/carnitine-CoA ligase